jgi:hypothetical protein
LKESVGASSAAPTHGPHIYNECCARIFRAQLDASLDINGPSGDDSSTSLKFSSTPSFLSYPLFCPLANSPDRSSISSLARQRLPFLLLVSETTALIAQHSLLHVFTSSVSCARSSNPAPTSVPTSIHPLRPLLTVPMARLTATIHRWLERRRYQYNVTLPLYMLSPAERFVFSAICQCSQ